MDKEDWKFGRNPFVNQVVSFIMNEKIDQMVRDGVAIPS